MSWMLGIFYFACGKKKNIQTPDILYKELPICLIIVGFYFKWDFFLEMHCYMSFSSETESYSQKIRNATSYKLGYWVWR